MFWAAVSVFGVFCSRVAVLVTSFWSFWKGFRPPVQGSAPFFWRLYSFPSHLIPPHLPPADGNRHTYRRNNTHTNTKTHTNTPKNKHNAQNLCICSIKIVSSNKIQRNKELTCTIYHVNFDPYPNKEFPAQDDQMSLPGSDLSSSKPPMAVMPLMAFVTR